MTHELGEGEREKIARRSALKRMADPVDVARSIEFLLGDGGRNITGTMITVDAGNTAQLTADKKIAEITIPRLLHDQ